MKTPREVLLQRHQAADAKLDQIRSGVVSQLAKTTTAREQNSSARVLSKLWRELIWPKPQAWASVAALWVLIFALKLSTHEALQVVARKSSVSPEAIAAVRQQKLFFAELVGTVELRATAPTKPVLPRPRSERRHKIRRDNSK